MNQDQIKLIHEILKLRPSDEEAINALLTYDVLTISPNWVPINPPASLDVISNGLNAIEYQAEAQLIIDEVQNQTQNLILVGDKPDPKRIRR